MSTLANASAIPDAHTCEQARLTRDPRFDGLFFTAVTSTRIYCRPVCPAPTAKRFTYYASAAAAEAGGYRPCLRCRPELSPGDGTWRRGDALLARALKLIEQGVLDEQPLSALAERVDIGERQLRRLFVERLGVSPMGVHGTRRLLFAKQLLTETAMPITEVALAAGFGSLRRFNAAFLDAYRMAPRDLRKQRVEVPGETLKLRLGYRPPYDFVAMLEVLRGRALPGVEVVDATSYSRVFGSSHAPGWLRVSQWPASHRLADDHALQLELHGARPSQMLEIIHRLRRMFDLDADPRAIADALGADARLRPLLKQHAGLRVPSGWDGFESAVLALIGPQRGVARARTLAARLSHHFGQPLPAPLVPGLDHLFPTPEALADADLESAGLTHACARTLRAMARALLEDHVDFKPERTLDDFTARWGALPGIGPRTAQDLALRVLGHPDAFPADDRVLRRAVPNDGSRMSTKALTARAEAWRPWRAYAVMHLWKDSMGPAKATSRASPPSTNIPVKTTLLERTPPRARQPGRRR
ncbi:helix-turn-helix domain-containing protein [Myxococcus stipitatus]|uniref:AlkA N-terminal domain-containing protein n=1 Tax=Myxococcus stipitatus TaxID=83455 RepID=UPI003144E22A